MSQFLGILQTKQMKENGQSSLNSLNKSGSQIKKPSHRKNSPINWFPRKKVDSYLSRKIKMLQVLLSLSPAYLSLNFFIKKLMELCTIITGSCWHEFDS